MSMRRQALVLMPMPYRGRYAPDTPYRLQHFILHIDAVKRLVVGSIPTRVNEIFI